MTCFIGEKEPGVARTPATSRASTSRPRSRRWATRASSPPSSSSTATGARPERILGGEEAGLGKGFVQMMDALEVGRVNVAARGVGIAQRALELGPALLARSARPSASRSPSTRRSSSSSPTWRPRSRPPACSPSRRRGMKDAGERSDLEAGMAKLFASETGKECVEDSLPHPRRLRLLEGVRDRAPLPRRAAAADRRGHLGDPAHGHRQEAPPAPQDLGRPGRGLRRHQEPDRDSRARSSRTRCRRSRNLKLVLRPGAARAR